MSVHIDTPSPLRHNYFFFVASWVVIDTAILKPRRTAILKQNPLNTTANGFLLFIFQYGIYIFFFIPL
jgi:hypothetical protein